ncbi:PspA/IM30 family protein [Methanocella arvoryzae]|uniref:PspA/IM30 family protein n=1 Tax=Methanocella arvoryzae (strain DSM 22066 / NBRC 105507 / MRE50) TaxID=351160 RepID=Q0W7U7_METAR|nr:hypothetical protein [Methanocella arvoryzae]CAJ35546.1 conserved hypothetical protein [Methanocella arvoryzae MRE50]
MGLFSRLTASIRARSKRWTAGQTDTQDYSVQSYETLRAEVKEAVESEESLKAEMLVQASRLNQCLHRQDELAADAVREGQDKKAAGLIYRRLLMSRQIGLLRSKIDAITAERVRLDRLLSRLKLKIQAFRDERKSLETRHLPHDVASIRMREAMAGMGEELTSVRYAIDRAKAKATEARISCETARRLAAGYALPAGDVDIPDQDMEPVASALKRLKAEMKYYDRPHPQR